MLKYAKVVDEQTKMVSVGVGENHAFYEGLGMTLQEVEQAYNGAWYLAGFVPAQPEPTAAEQVTALESKYQLPRPVRTALLLAREAGQNVDAELMARVNEIEALAVPLRQNEDAEGAA